MTRVAVAVALLVLFSGCNAFGVGGSESTEVATVSPVPVPDPTEVTATSTPGRCLAPPAMAPTNRTHTSPAEPAPLPEKGGAINGSALVEEHAERLANYRFHLITDDGTEVYSMPDAAAFAYEGIGLEQSAAYGYAVGGTLYTIESDRDEFRVRKRPYRQGSETNRRYAAVLTGREWLTDRVGGLQYERLGTETRNGTEVRVLRATLEPDPDGGFDNARPGVTGYNSTLYVDRRGIVRHVRHVRLIRHINRGPDYNATEVETLTVDELGTAQVRRPEAFCVPASSEVVVATPPSTR